MIGLYKTKAEPLMLGCANPWKAVQYKLKATALCNAAIRNKHNPFCSRVCSQGMARHSSANAITKPKIMQSGIVLRAVLAYYLLRPDGRRRQNKYLPVCCKKKRSAAGVYSVRERAAILLCFVDSARAPASENILFLLTWLFIHWHGVYHQHGAERERVHGPGLGQDDHLFPRQ